MKTSYRDEIEFTLAGIPCLIGVIYYNCVKGSGRYDAPSDIDYYGYTELDYDILDRKGYRARWLERKLDTKIKTEIELRISDYYEDMNNDY